MTFVLVHNGYFFVEFIYSLLSDYLFVIFDKLFWFYLIIRVVRLGWDWWSFRHIYLFNCGIVKQIVVLRITSWITTFTLAILSIYYWNPLVRLACWRFLFWIWTSTWAVNLIAIILNARFFLILLVEYLDIIVLEWHYLIFQFFVILELMW